MRILRIFFTSSLVALVLSVDVASAQDATRIGVFGGFNQAYFATTEGGESSAKQGYLVGAFTVFRRDKGLKLQPEIQVSQRRIGVTYARIDTLYETTYVNLSFLLRTKLFKGIYSTQGPQFSFPIQASLTVPGGTADTKDNTASDFSLVIGFGRQFGRIGFEGRWDAGFKQVEKIPLGGFIKRNRAITFMGIVGL